MKILIAASKYLPAVGGLEKAIHSIALEYKRLNHEVSIVTNAYKRGLSSKESIDSINVTRHFFTTTSPRIGNLWIWFKYGVRLLLAPYSFFVLFAKIKNQKPDVIHLHFVGAIAAYVLLARKFIRFPLVVSLHGSDVERYEEKTQFEKWILKQALKMADFVTANSRHLLSEALSKTNLTELSHCGVVPMAFSSEGYEQTHPYQHSKPYIFAAGRFVYKKGLDVLLEAFASVLKAGVFSGDLMVAGDGEEFGKYQQLARKLGIQDRVVFFGLANWSQMTSLMKGCEFFVIPSRLEAFGIVLLEALYSGKKVVASKVGGLVELMEENPDFLAEPGQADILAQKMIGTLNGKLVWKNIDKEQLQKKYSWKKVVESYLRIYKHLVSFYITSSSVLSEFEIFF